MMRRLVAIALILSCSGLSAEERAPTNINAGCLPADHAELDVILRVQETDRWCWAASAQMIMEYLGKWVPQCVQANDNFDALGIGHPDCCMKPTPEACIVGAFPNFKRYGFDFQRKDSKVGLSWAVLQAQLSPRDPNNPCSFTPFAFAWLGWKSPIGHMMVATGYYTAPNGDRYILINDPENKGRKGVPVLYSSYVSLKGRSQPLVRLV